ncbi:unnamed protein product, partial [marine sediment metagenome]
MPNDLFVISLISKRAFRNFSSFLKEEQINTIITAGSKIEEFGKKIKEYEMNWIHKVTTMRHAMYSQ